MRKSVIPIFCAILAILLCACKLQLSHNAANSMTSAASLIPFDRSKSGLGQLIFSIIEYDGINYYITDKVVDVKNSVDIKKIGEAPQQDGLKLTVFSIRGYSVKKHLAYRCVLATHVNYFVYTPK